jgi:lysophospholipase L1-like esterase
MIRTLQTRRVFLCLLNSALIFFAACGSGSETISEGDFSVHIPFLDDTHIDGDFVDWPESYSPIRVLSDIYGNAPDSADMYARFRLGWDREGLLIQAEINDDSIYEDPSKFWNGDGIELFISPSIGSFDIIQISVRPSLELPGSAASVMFYDHRRSDSLKSLIPESEFCKSLSKNGYRIEGRIPLKLLGINKPEPGMNIAVQIYFNDSDREEDSTNFSLPWFPARESYRNPYAFHKVRLSQSFTTGPAPEVRAYIVDDKNLHLKVLSEKPSKGKQLEVIAGEFKRQFNLHSENDRLFTQSWVIPLKKASCEKSKLSFLKNDSAFFGIEHCLLFRSYEELPEPNRFEDEIRIFEIMDHFRPPPPNAFLFTGSSTIRKWINLENDLPGLVLINRGFGGSTMKDLNFYRERIVFPYNPSRIYIYEGDNDIARGASPTEFIKECTEFVNACRDRIPDSEIYFMSIKPSLSRARNWMEMQEANRMLAELPSRFDKVHYIDISTGMLNAEGTPKKDIFEGDRLHLNDLGYVILSKALWSSVYE